MANLIPSPDAVRARPVVVAGSALRVLPEPGRGKLASRQPRLIEKAIKRLLTGYQRGGWFAKWMRSQPIAVAGEFRGVTELQPAKRARRSERVGNACALFQILLRTADLKTGRLGRPVGNGWEYPRVLDMDAWAFGAQVYCERSLRRTERILRELAAYGLLKLDERVKATPDGFRSSVALKSVTPAFWQLFGIANSQIGAMAAAVLDEKRARGAEVAALARSRADSTQGPVALAQVIASTAPTAALTGHDPPTGPPRAAADVIAQLKAKLDAL